MNGKKAKALRRQARQATVGRPAEQYQLKRSNGNNTYLRPIELVPGTTKAEYRRIKREG